MEKSKTETKIISWNVNGIRARLNAVKVLVETEQPDILCLQEIKVKDARPYLEAIPGYVGIVNTDKARSGHAGVAIYVQIKNLGEIDSDSLFSDMEGRILGINVCGIRIMSTYMPAKPLDRYRLIAEYVPSFLKRPCIVCGDLNCTAADIDHHCFFDDRENCRLSDKQGMRYILAALHMKDPYRERYPLSRAYTYWPYTDHCRERDIGMRIDYTLVSEDVSVVRAEILGGVMGSDHCPVSVTVRLDNKREENG